MKRYLFLFAVSFFLLSGCATYQETRRIEGDLNRKTAILDEKIGEKTADMTKNLENIREELRAIREQLQPLKEANEKLGSNIMALRKTQADRSADLVPLMDQIQQMAGANEKLQKDISIIMEKEAQLSEDLKNLRGKIGENKDISSGYKLTDKISSPEKSLGWEAKKDTPEEGQKSAKPNTALSQSPSPQKPADKDSSYDAAYKIFKAGQYAKARAAFQNYIKKFPASEYADNAQFWIGESYYLEKRYEEAILEYEKVAANYPKSDKRPSAKLKQGFSFLALGDKSSAKIIFKQIVSNYPHTKQARIAANKLAKMR